jgi:putative copper resistance protein D
MARMDLPSDAGRQPFWRAMAGARRTLISAAVAWLALVPLAAPALAHGEVPAEPPSPAGLLLGWSLEPAVLLPLLGVAAAWIWAVRRVNSAHPATPVPWRRSAAFLGGLAAIAAALLSGIERYDTTLFAIHMVQHLLLTLVAAPLIALGAPITLALRVATPAVRRRVLLPILHSRVVRVLAFPVVAWVVFAAVMWASHFSPLFDLALENRLVHDLEHALYLGSALLFWWPAVGLDPSPWRMSHPVRMAYVFLQMPQNTFLAVVVLNASGPLYPHYATLVRGWGPAPLADQQLAGSIMWLGGDLLFLAALAALLLGWMRHEERETVRVDRRLDREREAIRDRETRLAERLGRGRDGA